MICMSLGFLVANTELTLTNLSRKEFIKDLRELAESPRRARESGLGDLTRNNTPDPLWIRESHHCH